jgi:hypothetical protein
MRSGTVNNTTEQFKEFCSGKGCKNLGKTLLKIRYINKTGLFCHSCAEDLLDQGLAFEEERQELETVGQTSSTTIALKSSYT